MSDTPICTCVLGHSDGHGRGECACTTAIMDCAVHADTEFGVIERRAASTDPARLAFRAYLADETWDHRARDQRLVDALEAAFPDEVQDRRAFEQFRGVQ